MRLPAFSLHPQLTKRGSFDELTNLLDQDRDLDLIMLDLTMSGISAVFGLLYLLAKFPEIVT